MDNVVLLTGVTGFLGKVVLEELLRCRKIFNVDTVVVLIRPARSKSAIDRFWDKVVSSPCFSQLPAKWPALVEVVSGDVGEEGCGLEPEAFAGICERVTHVIHCAGSISFDVPLAEMLRGNVTGSLNVLELAQKCPNLQRFVSTSTAYVTPLTNEPIEEVLVPLPKPASLLFKGLLAGDISQDDILRLTGHPNLYTMAKCLTEHLLVERSEGTALSIVRPSIIASSLHYPSPGWVDSYAALTGVVAAVGAGMLHVLDADRDAVMDVVPVDEVSRHLIQEAFARTSKGTGPRIVHAVSTIRHGISVDTACNAMSSEFSRQKILPRPTIVYVGDSSSTMFRSCAAIFHRIPLKVAKTLARVWRDPRQVRRVQGVQKAQAILSTTLKVFSHSTYDFRTKEFELHPEYESHEYMHSICRGVRKYLLHTDGSQRRGG